MKDLVSLAAGYDCMFMSFVSPVCTIVFARQGPGGLDEEVGHSSCCELVPMQLAWTIATSISPALPSLSSNHLTRHQPFSFQHTVYVDWQIFFIKEIW